MNYRINHTDATIRTTEEGSDNVDIFGHFQTAKAELIARLQTDITEIRKKISWVRSLAQRGLEEYDDSELEATEPSPPTGMKTGGSAVVNQ